uniref:Glyceronephosphate O-acyltransferase n=1 Tax=Lates calcarifer TaxID=8187 RepID=A0A4W6F061_LATCA
CCVKTSRQGCFAISILHFVTHATSSTFLFICCMGVPRLCKKEMTLRTFWRRGGNSSDLRYALRCYAPVVYKGLCPSKAGTLKSMVLQSDQLQLCHPSAVDDVQEEASSILEEMAHRLQLSTVRFPSPSHSAKSLKPCSASICVNEEGIQRCVSVERKHRHPTSPGGPATSHRSYMDFLLMSYLLYTYDLALPVIAAGMDFMGMKFVGEMLRMSGAFFIRRSFGGDKLYWAVFSEYVKTMLKNGFAPVEFFLEGTRSRTSKSLTPKLGLLNIVMDPFFKGEVFDVSLVPVSISYERILEESLYARELLGVPKPKESTSGLIKARKVLSEDYGSIHVYFGQPVSVRSLAEGRVNRCQFNLIPRYNKPTPSYLEDIHSFVNDSAYRLVRAQEENMVLKPWVLLASLLLQNQVSGQKRGIALDELTEQAVWLRDLSRQYGAFLHWPEHTPPSEVVSSSLSLHRGLVRISEGRVQLPRSAVTPEEELLSQAVIILSCASYRNQALHVFLRPALLASAIHTEVFNSFSFLRNMFSNEFILCPGATDFEEACYLLVKTGALQVTQQEVLVTERGHRTLVFLTSMLDPFLQGYQVSLFKSFFFYFLSVLFSPQLSVKFTDRVWFPGRLRYTEVLSSDLQKNSLAALLRLGAVRKIKGYVGFDHPYVPGFKQQQSMTVILQLNEEKHPLETA